MGAWMAERVVTGKTANEAWNKARRDASEENGHQDGYSGDVNSGGYGFVKVDLPKGCSYKKFHELLEDDMYNGEYEVERAMEDIKSWTPGGFFNRKGNVRGWKGNLAKANKALAKARKDRANHVRKVEAAGFYISDFESLARIYNDKWSDYLCIELSAHLAKKSYPRAYETKRRGEKIFIFFGYAPS